MKNRIIRLFSSEHDAYNDDGARVSEIISRHVEALFAELELDAQAQATDSEDNPAYGRAEIETMVRDKVGWLMIFASAERSCKARMAELGMTSEDC